MRNKRWISGEFSCVANSYLAKTNSASENFVDSSSHGQNLFLTSPPIHGISVTTIQTTPNFMSFAKWKILGLAGAITVLVLIGKFTNFLQKMPGEVYGALIGA